MMWIIFTNGVVFLILFWQNVITLSQHKEIMHQLELLRVTIDSLEKVKNSNHSALMAILEKTGAVVPAPAPTENPAATPPPTETPPPSPPPKSGGWFNRS